VKAVQTVELVRGSGCCEMNLIDSIGLWRKVEVKKKRSIRCDGERRRAGQRRRYRLNEGMQVTPVAR
jgi:Zn ribbon nucleic-acid-binding protein